MARLSGLVGRRQVIAASGAPEALAVMGELLRVAAVVYALVKLRSIDQRLRELVDCECEDDDADEDDV